MQHKYEIGRVYLNVPYAEKDSAKALGARWCAVKRQWWVSNVGACPGVHRWLVPGRLREQAKEADDFLRRTHVGKKVKRPKARPVDPHAPRSTPRIDFSLPDCACTSPPWEHCPHTAESDDWADGDDAAAQHMRDIALEV